MSTTDASIPEIMQNAEFVVIQFPLSKKARNKRALKIGALAGSAAFVAVMVVGTIVKNVNNETPEEA